MKIAIRGHKSRGKEVIQILESFGGRNTFNYNGDYIKTAYFIGMDYSIYGFCTDSPKVGFKVYTLEEFETQFPFKIGENVIYSYTPNFVGTVVDIKFDDNVSYRVDINGTICTCGTTMLKHYKEMNTRNVTLTLEKAKEWYKKGGELKEIALQAFTEEELTKVELPKTWEEYIQQNFHREGYVLTHLGSIAETEITGLRGGENLCPSKQSAEAHLAMIQLEQLRDCWRQGWVPDYTKTYKKFRIKKLGTEYIVDWATGLSDFLVFQTEKLAKEFLKCFRDLIEKAGDLI